MRAGSNCSVYQALTSEALGVLKLSITLARRRDHAQVTPLHVANTMLASSSGHLRKACLQSNSHPLQCKALELCLNVALNRLPVSSSSTSTSMLTPRHNHPTISNALAAVFKRAQAHRRRGSIESQQQPILAVKIELEHLVISILDDPSVSRVMKEAGFSSPQVKSNVEKLSNGVHNKVGIPKSSSQARNEDLMWNREPINMKRSEHDQCIKWISLQAGTIINDRDEHQLTSCTEYSEAQSLKNSNTTTLPTWLQLYKEENQKLNKDDPMQMDIFSNPNSTASSDDVVKEAQEYIKCFEELNSRNIDILSNALVEKVPSRKDIVPSILSTILQCRSGMMGRKGNVGKDKDGNVNCEIKEETWFLFQGTDFNAKEKIARELARLIFGSQTSLVTISLRNEPRICYLERLADEIATNPHRVFLIKDVDQADYCSQMGIKMTIESGRIKSSIEKETSLSDAIIILSNSETNNSCSRACSSATKMGDVLEKEEISHCLSLDLNTSCNYDENRDDRSIDYIELSDFVDKWIVF